MGGATNTGFKTLDGRDNVEAVVGDNGRLITDTFVNDQTTPALITKFNQSQTSTVLTAEGVQFSYDIEVASTVGMSVGTSFIILFDVGTGRFYLGYIIAINGLTVTLDTQLDFAFPVGTIVDVTITDMSVDGSVTPQIFGIRGLGIIPGIDQEYDITRIIFKCFTTSAVDLSKFGDIAGGLTKGLALRHRDGTVNNIFNVKTNGDIEGITLDWKPFSAQNPNQGQNGFSARLTFGGQDKIGVVQRIGPGEDLEIIVQDDLTGITLLEIIAEGHQVEE